MAQKSQPKWTLNMALKTGVFCAMAGTLSGLIREYGAAEYATLTLTPGILFGIALAISNKQFFKHFWLTLIGLVITAGFIYPMMVVLTQKVFNVSTIAEVIAIFPFLSGLIPSLLGANLLYLTYSTFIEKHSWRFYKWYVVAAFLVGIIFFPLMQWSGNFILSYMIWQGVIGFYLTQLHRLKSKVVSR